MATIKKISNCGQTIPLVCAVLRYVLENLHMPHVLHTTALAKVTLNWAHTTGWVPAKFGISPISRKLSWGNGAANAKRGMFFGIFGFFSHTLKYHTISCGYHSGSDFLCSPRVPPSSWSGFRALFSKTVVFFDRNINTLTLPPGGND